MMIHSCSIGEGSGDLADEVKKMYRNALCNLREDLWIFKYRKTVRKIVKYCVNCRRFETKPKISPEGPLPEDSVREASVFEIVGINYAGRLIIKGGQKVWLVIFTCAVYRALHL
ncbi:integrase catalytic domain-containing protein [Trichonephila clavipes]|nr:integrase catalytic domain-containing protein [Trichonephila clavipes]